MPSPRKVTPGTDRDRLRENSWIPAGISSMSPGLALISCS